MKNNEKIEILFEGMRYIMTACDTIDNAGRCEECPILGYCIKDTTLEAIAEEATMGWLTEFLELAEETDNNISEADYIADLADRARKAERDEWYD